MPDDVTLHSNVELVVERYPAVQSQPHELAAASENITYSMNVQLCNVHCVSKKSHFVIRGNFNKYSPIFKILSLV